MGDKTLNLFGVPKECVQGEVRKDFIYDHRRGYYLSAHWRYTRKIYDFIDIEKVLSDGEVLMLYRLAKYSSPHTNALYILKGNSMEPMTKEDIMKVTNRGEWTVRKFLDKCQKAHFIAIISKKYEEEALSMFCINPFIALPGGGWINPLLFQMWKDECKKYLSPVLYTQLEKESFSKEYDLFKYSKKFGYCVEPMQKIFKNIDESGEF